MGIDPRAEGPRRFREGLLDALGLDEASPDGYVAAQTAKRDDAIDPPPADAGLAGHEVPLAELVRLAVSAGDGLAWGGTGMPWQLDDAAEMLAAAALDRARNGDATGAWERVHAMWILARSVKGPADFGASSCLSCSAVSMPGICIERQDDVSGASWPLARSQPCISRISTTWDWSIFWANLKTRGFAPCAPLPPACTEVVGTLRFCPPLRQSRFNSLHSMELRHPSTVPQYPVHRAD